VVGIKEQRIVLSLLSRADADVDLETVLEKIGEKIERAHLVATAA